MNIAKNKHLLLVITVLILIGGSLFSYRWLHLKVPLTPQATQETWTIEATLRFTANNPPITADFFIPNAPPNFATLDETFVSRNYGVTAETAGPNRLATWTIRRASGLQALYYRTVVYHSNVNAVPLTAPTVITKAAFNDAESAAVEAIISLVRSRSSNIRTFTAETIKILNDRNNDNSALLLKRDYSLENIAATISAVVSHANIYATEVKGILLNSQRFAELYTGLTVWNGQEWLFFNPSDGRVGLPHNFFIWQYGNAPLFSLKGGSNSQFSIAVTENPISAIDLAQERADLLQSRLIKFSLFGMPVKTQLVYLILLSVPIGAFVILLLRNFIGLTTFGTFMPVLIALAFRETQLITGIILFTLIVSVGLFARFYLDQLRLLLVPRLTAILTVVVLAMMLVTVISQQLGLERGLSIALFPIVILTMTIERMSIVWDERGAAEAIKSGIGSLIAAIIAYLVMTIDEVQYLFFAFPELLLILLALTLAVGKYSGYRLTELKRFRAFIKE